MLTNRTGVLCILSSLWLFATPAFAQNFNRSQAIQTAGEYSEVLREFADYIRAKPGFEDTVQKTVKLIGDVEKQIYIPVEQGETILQPKLPGYVHPGVQAIWDSLGQNSQTDREINLAFKETNTYKIKLMNVLNYRDKDASISN